MIGGVDRPRLVAVVAATGLLLVAGMGVAFVGPGLGSAPSPDITFEEATNESGISYHDANAGGIGNGDAGVFTADVDDDGWTDVLTTGGEQPVLWHNEEGEFVRSESLPNVSAETNSATFVDYDGDGLDDLIVFPPYSEPVSFHNEGGTFERTDLGLGNHSYVLGGAAADYDGDGDEDLLVYQTGDWSNGKPAGYQSLYLAIEDDNGNPNVLYENVDGTFERVEDSGLSDPERWTLAASFVDLNDDGRPDVHVANDFNSDFVYFNQGDGTFEPHRMGNATARNGMASEISDVNGDGTPDVFTTNIELPISRETMGPERYERLEFLLSFEVRSSRTEGNTLSLNNGNGTFRERADNYSLRVGGWGWAASHADLNNDGQRDMIHSTENIVQIYQEEPIYTYPMVWEGEGDNFTRLDASEIGFAEDDGRGLVTLDYDRDGDLDVISANYDSRFTVYENTVEDERVNALEVLAVDENGGAAYGATVEVDAGSHSRTVFQHSRTDFLSQTPRETHLGLGSRESATLHVTWPDGTERTFQDVEAGQYVRLTRSGDVETVVEFEE